MSQSTNFVARFHLPTYTTRNQRFYFVYLGHARAHDMDKWTTINQFRGSDARSARLSRIEIALMLFLNECTKPARACLPIHSISIHTTHMQYTECFHVDLSVYNVFIVHPKEQCGNVNQAKPGGQATQMYHYNAEDQDRNV